MLHCVRSEIEINHLTRQLQLVRAHLSIGWRFGSDDQRFPHADLIVSGDAHLRNLKRYQSMRTVAAAEALAIVERG